jgi:ubiquinone/menaquinone biosynthesis C-methylase UbiE
MAVSSSGSPATAPERGGASAPPAAAFSFAESYERALVGPLFRPWAAMLLDRLPRHTGARVLDVACGTGIVARLARRRFGAPARIVGVDRNAAMLAVARQLEPDVEWREGDAAALPLDDASVDVVLCHQGLQFFADRPAALREMRRVVAPGGVVAIGVWRSLEENGLFHELGAIAERFVGPVADARHGFPDAGALADLISDAGFADVVVEPMSLPTRFHSADELVRLNAMAVVGMSVAGRGMSPDERAATVERLVAASLEATARYASGDGIEFRTAANLATARR